MCLHGAGGQSLCHAFIARQAEQGERRADGCSCLAWQAPSSLTSSWPAPAPLTWRRSPPYCSASLQVPFPGFSSFHPFPSVLAAFVAFCPVSVDAPSFPVSSWASSCTACVQPTLLCCLSRICSTVLNTDLFD